MLPLNVMERGKYTLKVYQDTDPMSPRDWDNLGTIVAFHSRYNLGDKHKFSSPEEVMEYIDKNNCVWLPINMYEHGGISLSTSSKYPYNDLWDSGQVGVIFVTKERILSEYKAKRLTKKLKTKIENLLNSEIETYSHYLSGEVYGYVIEKTIEAKPPCKECEHVEPEYQEHVDSCWGFYGTNAVEVEALEALGHHFESEGVSV